MYYIPTTYLTVRDDEGPIVFQREDLMRYSGNRGLIASGVTFRLLGAAFEDLCPNEIPHREYSASALLSPAMKSVTASN